MKHTAQAPEPRSPTRRRCGRIASARKRWKTGKNKRVRESKKERERGEWVSGESVRKGVSELVGSACEVFFVLV